MVVPQVRKYKVSLQCRGSEGGGTLLNSILGRKVDNFIGRFIILQTITRRDDRCIVSMGMEGAKIIKVGVLGTC
jgi:hypothetical protein